jgi:hypothetical protein
MRGANYVRGDIEAKSGGTLTARNLQADLPLDPTLIPQVPRDMSGSVQANLESLHVEKGAIKSIVGHLEGRNLVTMLQGQRLALGNYSLVFPAATPGQDPVGQLRSLSGPMNVEATLRLTPEPGVTIQGLVAPTAEASPQLVSELRALGSPDAQGRRPFGFETTF